MEKRYRQNSKKKKSGVKGRVVIFLLFVLLFCALFHDGIVNELDIIARLVCLQGDLLLYMPGRGKSLPIRNFP